MNTPNNDRIIIIEHMFFVNYLQGRHLMNKTEKAIETRLEAMEKKLDKIESCLSEMLKDKIAKDLRVDSIENLATDLEDSLMTVGDNVDFIKDAFDNMDKKLDILATLLMPED